MSTTYSFGALRPNRSSKNPCAHRRIAGGRCSAPRAAADLAFWPPASAAPTAAGGGARAVRSKPRMQHPPLSRRSGARRRQGPLQPRATPADGCALYSAPRARLCQRRRKPGRGQRKIFIPSSWPTNRATAVFHGSISPTLLKVPIPAEFFRQSSDLFHS